MDEGNKYTFIPTECNVYLLANFICIIRNVPVNVYSSLFGFVHLSRLRLYTADGVRFKWINVAEFDRIVYSTSPVQQTLKYYTHAYIYYYNIIYVIIFVLFFFLHFSLYAPASRGPRRHNSSDVDDDATAYGDCHGFSNRFACMQICAPSVYVPCNNRLRLFLFPARRFMIGVIRIQYHIICMERLASWWKRYLHHTK